MAITIVDIPVSQLMPNPHNPRRDVGDVTELADSIRAQGIKQELLVTPADDRDGVPQYRVVIGHRRLAAARLAGRDMVPCRVEELSAREERELMLVENTQRVDLTPLEEADGYQGLLDLGVKVKEMAERTGRSMRLVRGRLRIASIPRSVREASPAFAQLSLSELEAIAEFDGDEKAQAMLAAKAGSNDFEWQLNRLRRERDRREWVEAARLWAESNNLPMLPDNLKTEDMWANPKGYERQRRFGQDYTGQFSKQWRDWQAEGKHPGAVIRIFDDAGSVVAYTPAKKTAEEREDGKAEAKRRMERERRHKVRELAQASAELRCEWIRTTVPVLKADVLRDMTERLTLLELMGAGDYMDGTSLDSNGWTRVVKAYSLFARPLPVVDKDPEHGVYTLNVAENPAELRRRQSVPSRRSVELLLLLLARREGRDRHGHVGPSGVPARPQDVERLLRDPRVGRLRGVGRGEEGAGAVNTKVVIRVRNGDDAPVSVERLVVDSRAEVGAGVTPMLLMDMLRLLDDSCHVTDVEIRRAEP